MKKEDLYICVHDYQGGEFGMYRAYTLEQWREQALDWCDSDENDENYKLIKNLPKKYVIDYINDMWQIEIVKVGDTQKDEIIKYLVDKSRDTQYYGRLIRELFSFLSNDDEYYDEKERICNEIINYFDEIEEKLYNFKEKEN